MMGKITPSSAQMRGLALLRRKAILKWGAYMLGVHKQLLEGEMKVIELLFISITTSFQKLLVYILWYLCTFHAYNLKMNINLYEHQMSAYSKTFGRPSASRSKERKKKEVNYICSTHTHPPQDWTIPLPAASSGPQEGLRTICEQLGQAGKQCWPLSFPRYSCSGEIIILTQMILWSTNELKKSINLFWCQVKLDGSCTDY